MKINRMNYEAFVMDYIEGTLDNQSKIEMQRFLQEHPDVRQEIEEVKAFAMPELEPLSFPHKADLVKTRRIGFRSILAIAASLTLLLSVAVALFNEDLAGPSTEIAQTPIDIIDESNLPDEDVSPTKPLAENTAISIDQRKREDSKKDIAIAEEEIHNQSIPSEKLTINPEALAEVGKKKLRSSDLVPAETNNTNPVIPVPNKIEIVAEMNDSSDPLQESKETITDKPRVEREVVAQRVLPKLSSHSIEIYSTSPKVDLQWAAIAATSEAIANNDQNGLKKLYRKIQPEVFENKPLGTIKEALVPEALANLFSNRTKVD